MEHSVSKVHVPIGGGTPHFESMSLACAARSAEDAAAVAGGADRAVAEVVTAGANASATGIVAEGGLSFVQCTNVSATPMGRRSADFISLIVGENDSGDHIDRTRLGSLR
jgi:hypothetical protein